jgi:hypothetical protein
MEMRSNAALIEERTSTPLEPDTLVPAQYFDRMGTDIAFQPEKRLILAVLEEAIATFQRHVGSTAPRSTRLVQDVEDLTDARDQDWPFSFENICAALNLECEYVRAGMVRWKAAERRRAGIGQSAVYRFPFRRVNGRRHSITGPREYLKKSA